VLRVWVIGWIAACAAPVAEPLHAPREKPHPADPPAITTRPDRAYGKRPELDLSTVAPSFEEELRWPLPGSIHPMLEPRYEIGKALAEPGVSWNDLCRMGIQGRHASSGAGQEQMVYLRGWCSVANHDLDAAVGYFATLVHPLVSGMQRAIPLDFADILVDGCRAGEALHLLDKHTVVAPEVFDTLAATYYEVDRLEDARDVNLRALQGDQHEPATCHRRVREIALAERWNTRELTQQFSDLVGDTSDPACMTLAHLARCVDDPAEHCKPYFQDENINLGYVHLFAAYYGWPRKAATFSEWSVIAQAAADAIPLAGADLLATEALEAALRSSECHGYSLYELEKRVTRLQALPHDPALDARLKLLAQVGDCDARVPPGANPPADSPFTHDP
jgi:hypothetical protein